MSRPFIKDVIEVHGGQERWRSIGELRLRISTGGFAFLRKLQSKTIRNLEARVATRTQRTVFSPYPAAGLRGVFEGGTVRIESETGEIIHRRDDPRPAFRNFRQRLCWDRLDLLYFAGYALWTYLNVPFLLAEPGFEVRELEAWEENGGRWRRLAVTFPPHIHTHSREQVFYFDEKGLLRRQDYTAEPFGDWAKAANYCYQHETSGGLVFPTRRKVYPRRSDNRPRSRPLLVWIELSNIQTLPG